MVRDESGALWREDATSAHTDRFRAYVRHKIVPVAKEWNSALPEVLTRSMNLIADEDDMLQNMAEKLAEEMCIRDSPWTPPAARPTATASWSSRSPAAGSRPSPP